MSDMPGLGTNGQLSRRSGSPSESVSAPPEPQAGEGTRVGVEPRKGGRLRESYDLPDDAKS